MVPVHERVLQQRDDRVDVVLAHLADVLEHEAQGLEDSVLHIRVWDLVLVHDARNHSEGRARLRDDGDGHGGAHPVLPVLDLEVVQKGCQHVAWADGLGDVTKSVHSRPPDRLLVSLEHLQ